MIRLSFRTVTIAILIFAVIYSPHAGAIYSTDDYMSANNAPWYNGREVENCSTATPGIIVTGEVAADIYNFLISTPFAANDDTPMNAFQASGVLGNAWVESGMDPSATNSSSGAYGIVQWLGERKAALLALAAERNKEPSELSIQLEYLKIELDGSEGENLFGDTGTPGDSISTEGFSNASSPEAAAYRFDKKFERSEGDKVSERQIAARGYYNTYADASSDGSSYTQRAIYTNCGATRFSGELVVMQQCRNSWSQDRYSAGTICTHGCGPSSMANIITNMTGVAGADPGVLASEARTIGGEHPTLGSDTSQIVKLAERYGLRHEIIGTGMVAGIMDSNKIAIKSKINLALDNGAFVLISGRAGHRPWYSYTGHVIVIAGRADDGRWIILDSSSPNAQGGKGPTGGDLYEQEDIMIGMHINAYAVYK